MKMTIATMVCLCALTTTAFARACPGGAMQVEPRMIGDAAVDGGNGPIQRQDDRPSNRRAAPTPVLAQSAYCAMPILNDANVATAEFGPGDAHWWGNTPAGVVTLLSTGMVPAGMMHPPGMDAPRMGAP